MSALRVEDLPAKKIRHPEDLALPPRDKVLEVVEKLSPDRCHLFLGELLGALQNANNDHDLAHVQHVFDGWYRTLIFEEQPEHDQRWEKAQIFIESNGSRPGMTIGEMRGRLGLAEGASTT